MIISLVEIAVIIGLVVVLLPVIQGLVLVIVGLPILFLHGLGRLFNMEGTK